MSAIDDFLATQPQASGMQATQSAPQNVDAIISRDATAAAVPPALRAPQTAQAAQPGFWSSLCAGLGHGFGSSVLGAQQLAGNALSSAGQQQTDAAGNPVLPRAQGVLNAFKSIGDFLSGNADQGLQKASAEVTPYQQAHPIATGAGNIAGMTAATAPLAAVAPEIGGMGLLGRTATGAALGAANGAVAPVMNPGSNFWQQKLGQIASNA